MMIPFLPEWKEMMLSGRKTHTCRSKKYGEPGERFEIFGAVFEIVTVRKTTLRDVRNNYWRQEGCQSQEDFEAVWNKIHPGRGFQEDDFRWLHEFRRVGSEIANRIEVR